MERQPGALTLSEGDRQVLAVWAANCAERRLSLFEAQAPTDTRPRDALEGLRAFARGEMRIGKVRSLSAQAHAAAREIGDPAAVAAARAAGQAAGVAHMAAHARGAAAYAAKAAGLAAPQDATAVANELEWQQIHASPAVRDVLRRLPAPTRPAGTLGALISEMHARLTRDSVASQQSITVALPVADRRTTFAFYTEGLGFHPLGDPADDGVPEPLQFALNDGVRVMFIPTGGFGWVTGNHATATSGQSECLLVMTLADQRDLHALVDRARGAGAEIVMEPAEQPWGYTALFADPDGHLWQLRSATSEGPFADQK